MNASNFVIKVDCRSDSLQVVILNRSDDQEEASSLFYYPWQSPSFYSPFSNQHSCSLNYYNACLEEAVKYCLVQAGHNVVENIKAVLVDTSALNQVKVETRTGSVLYSEFDSTYDQSCMRLKEQVAFSVMHILQVYKSCKK